MANQVAVVQNIDWFLLLYCEAKSFEFDSQGIFVNALEKA